MALRYSGFRPDTERVSPCSSTLGSPVILYHVSLPSTEHQTVSREVSSKNRGSSYSVQNSNFAVWFSYRISSTGYSIKEFTKSRIDMVKESSGICSKSSILLFSAITDSGKAP